ncbi:ABC transporter ATP-binding protein [Spiractinospora alimapuensis]|uniref:ABC transporter ATP-binding protein n=1 Tax=Spiractinospora alimapuensis TaxID=2820884 RepID=UPI001F2310EC|nr:ABC transporter ATP-binding protein [Spiractinospora alimapuensis]QVQ50145.1 ABC transporter ATP-binding protein [Spiractinospora alimapuensis]
MTEIPTDGLAVDQLSVGYGSGRRRRTVLSDVNALARPGDLTVLLGPNGTGKSTLLRALAGLAAPFAGRCLVNGTDVTRLRGADRARLLATVLTQRDIPGLLRAREVVALGRHPYTSVTGRLSPEDQRAVDWALDAVGAEPLAGRRVGELSDGERQRVLTARALAQAPDVLLLDEPTAFLDVAGKVALHGLLLRLARDNGLVVVMCTHDLELALRVADHVWLLAAGGLRGGSPEELARRGDLSEVFDGADLTFDTERWVFQPRGLPSHATAWREDSARS